MPEERTATPSDPHAETITLHGKLEALATEITGLMATIADLEARQTVALADAYLAGTGDEDSHVMEVRAELAKAQAQLTEREAIHPVLCGKLQAARHALRQVRIQAQTEAITKTQARQEEIKRQVAALDAQRLPLLAEFGRVEDAMIAATHERSRLQQRTAAWDGTLEDLDALTHAPEAAIRPDEIVRVLADWRAQEQRESCRISRVELGYETATGKITSARISRLQSREELKELAFVERDRAARKEQRERTQRDADALNEWRAAQTAAKATR